MAQLQSSSPSSTSDSTLSVGCWNIAAVNNNPLEYWVDYENPAYRELMLGVEQTMLEPGERDVPLGSIFPEEAFQRLTGKMRDLGYEGVDEVCQMWVNDLSSRPIISGFFKDKSLGSKRFISMPDRFTNTINTLVSVTDSAPAAPACRPTVINNYLGDLGSFDAWWSAWFSFMFEEPLAMHTKQGPAAKIPCELISKISRKKYEALSEEEERISVPMQLLCLALFDCTLVHVMNVLSPSREWLDIKQTLCGALVTNKPKRTLDILCGSMYAGCDVLCLQEVATSFLAEIDASPLGTSHHVVMPAKSAGSRNQNSILLLKKATFPAAAATDFVEVTDEVRAACKGEVADGDLVAVIAADKTGVNFLVASFHGDTEGLQSIPVLEAVHAAVQARNVSGDGAVEAKGAAQETKLIFGLDANVYQEPPGKKPHLHYVDWLESCASLGMATNFGALGSAFDPVVCRTTMNARTFCQPQLQKAVRLSEFDKGDCNPKDYVVFYANQFEGVKTNIDKTGDGGLALGAATPDGSPVHTPLPSLVWPSDHVAVLTTIRNL